jgi:hypothetical protein
MRGRAGAVVPLLPFAHGGDDLRHYCRWSGSPAPVRSTGREPMTLKEIEG